VEEIPLQISGHDDQVESRRRQRMLCEICAPRVHLNRCRSCCELRVAHRVEARIDAKRAEAGACYAYRDAPVAHREIERASMCPATRRKTRHPLIDESRSRVRAAGPSAGQG
jgi:hypothetical protein